MSCNYPASAVTGSPPTRSQTVVRAGSGAAGRPGESAAFTPGLLLGGRYQVVRLLGRSGLGEVWQALDLKLRVDVALKRLRPEWVGDERMLERLRGEARAARDVVSPNVCRIFDLVVLDGAELVPLLVEEPATASLLDSYRKDVGVLTWWGSAVECASAIARLERDGDLAVAAAGVAFERLAALSAAWHEIQPRDEVREAAVRFLRVHDLRAADALQLAAAFMAAERPPATLAFVCLEDRLELAASRKEFRVVSS